MKRKRYPSIVMPMNEESMRQLRYHGSVIVPGGKRGGRVEMYQLTRIGRTRRPAVRGGAMNASARAFADSGLIQAHTDKASDLKRMVQNPNFYWDPKRPNWVWATGYKRGLPFLLDQEWYGVGEAWKRGLNVAVNAGKGAVKVVEGVFSDNPGKAAEGGIDIGKVVKGGRLRRRASSRVKRHQRKRRQL